MRSYRVHLSNNAQDDPVPYLLMGVAQNGRLFLNFASLDPMSPQTMPPLVLSTDALYEVIQGQPASFSRDGSILTLRKSGNELLIECHDEGAALVRQHRVWLAEIALGWNMLRGNTQNGMILA